MARKTTIPPLLAVKFEFVDALDAIVSKSLVLQQAVQTALDLGAIDPKIADRVQKALDDFGAAMFTRDDV